jgi:hypothetical protein
MPYTDDLKNHLGQYKDNDLKVQENGLWDGRPYAHILPEEQSFLNILEPFRDVFRLEHEVGKLNFTLDHPNHLNSSQAMGINLAFPFMFSGWYSPLLAALEIDPEPIAEAAFESVMDDQTHVDLLLRGQSGRNIYCEIKLKESGFGEAKAVNTDYEQIFQRHLPQLELVIKSEYLTFDIFKKYYQLFRYMALLSPQQPNVFCLIVPHRNKAFQNGIAFLEESVLETMKQKIKLAYLEDVVERLLESLKMHDQIHRHFSLFKEKYISF